MRYASGNYEALVRPRRPEGIEDKRAWLVGSGLASLAAAAFLVRDAQMPGQNITILEASDLPGGACDGILDPRAGFKIRGGREMENHFECLWDLFSSIDSLREPGISVLDEFYRLNIDDPNYSLMRATSRQGHDDPTFGQFTLSAKAQREMTKLFLTPDRDLENKRIEDVLGPDFMESNFWLYWRTMFAFETWHSALEMKLYLQRFIHHIGGLPDFTALKFTKYNQFESLIQPLVAYLTNHGVQFQYSTRVTNVLFDFDADASTARRIEWLRDGQRGGVDLGRDDLVFITNGSCVENSRWGDHHTAPAFDPEIREGGIWSLWRNIAEQSPAFGRPDVFCGKPELSQWESASLTTLDERVLPYLRKISRRDPLSGRVVTGGIVSVRDSSWLMSWTINRQPHFEVQPGNQAVVWIYGLFTDRPGDFVKKPMRECTGEEIAQEWLYHLGVPVAEIPELAAHSVVCLPCMMPYITAFFMPRQHGDRPDVVPAGATNYAFIGQFAETQRDTIFTTEYSVRTGMESVYQLVGVERGVPEVWPGAYDIRVLLAAAARLRDGKKIRLPRPIAKRIKKTVIADLLSSSGLT